MEIIQSKLCTGCLLQNIWEQIAMETHAQKSFVQEMPEESLDEVTETFTETEQQELLNLLKTKKDHQKRAFIQLKGRFIINFENS